jgi:hypothetical protein
MLDFVKNLFENNVISEDMVSEIETAWKGKIQENREQVTAQLREEFAQKYEHDKASLTEAVEAMISDRLNAELSELAEDRQGLIEARAKYAKKMKKDSAKLEEFVKESLASELAELHSDRRSVVSNVEALEAFIVESLAKEIAEFHADKQDLAEAKVRLVQESKAKFLQVKKDFIANASQIVEETVTRGLRTEMTQLREDIEAARKNDFGRRIFETFASEYAASLLNENSEVAKLMNSVKEHQQKLDEATAIVAKAKRLVESKDAEIKRLAERQERLAVMGELLGPLSGEKREVMSELLESVQTDKLRSAFNKYIPAVMNGQAAAPSNRVLSEGKEITGNKQERSFGSDQKTAEIVDIRRLAGLKAQGEL